MFGIFGRLLWESLNGMLTLSDIKGTTSNFWFFCVSVKWRDKDSHNKLPKMPNILHVVRSLYLFIWHIYKKIKKINKSKLADQEKMANRYHIYIYENSEGVYGSCWNNWKPLTFSRKWWIFLEFKNFLNKMAKRPPKTKNRKNGATGDILFAVGVGVWKPPGFLTNPNRNPNPRTFPNPNPNLSVVHSY